MTDVELEVSEDHPAPFSRAVLDAVAEIVGEETERLCRRLRILDPFAGIGRVHDLDADTVGVELQPRWAGAREGTLVGDATDLPREWRRSFDAVVTSPCYGNRMADTYDGSRDTCTDCSGKGERPDADPHDGEDPRCPRCAGSGTSPSRRVTYTIAHGSPLEPNNAGALQWGPAYRSIHAKAWKEAYRVLRPGIPEVEPGGLLVVNISNHIRDRKVVRVAEWHLDVMLRLGLLLVEARRISTPRMRHGANYQARVESEHLLVLRRADLPNESQGELFDG